MQREIVDKLAYEILAGRFHAGQIVRVDYRDGQIVFEAIEQPEVVEEEA